ncbi:MAG: LacI family DNA-binding transcriptional regulator [Hydrogenophaga sp.]|jgi:LacI family gluconate utilization system Gnt-I transcriptional repressor|uniref:LacI family DNA-binding transcriptional regulator n=1 Tax=Hydrogenophaga sp. TaxID=1904254 RepID=UPI00273174EC|nr:LacI family DNA-binding transcriptional regulator [Hydrogenophaga sp.]MDP2074437.1 LacI family DNA-binding transcriptional regulator [Hydrogenophaga sp.]MDP2249540.1 LacI family DNA-binding transcriptional regulator [Hydrogenophaga sp.]MDP3108261.1 LacI family DNA-binding transcriptional regulator [Hydrogenophaga sp.]MDZ4123621.1 LacI family DNA-binding transcriptional regulator [Hydrogenophaga sp.]MDZ4281365.1 LacI family DNA-binding transcriptional regulator [Hydrogenophaga sp.]
MKETDNSRRARRGSGAITLRDVAKLAGVAPITASRVLNTPEQVSVDVRQKVLDAVQKTGYVPNRMAGGLASSRSRLIAAVVPSTVMSVFMPTIEALNDTLFDAGYQLMLGQSGYSAAREESLLEAIIGRRPDGIFLTGILHPGLGRTRLMASGIPVVETWDLTPTPIDMLVGFSHADIGREVARFLMAKGRRKLALIRAEDERADRRASAFIDAVQRAGLAQVAVVNVGASRSLQSGRNALGQLLAQAPDVDAVFCSSDLLALGVLTEARVRGIAIPDQLAIMGFGDVPFAADMAPALSTVHINGVDIGRLAARHLIDRAEGREVAQRVVDVGFSIVERETS